MTTAMTIPATNVGRRTDALARHAYTVPVVRELPAPRGVVRGGKVEVFRRPSVAD